MRSDLVDNHEVHVRVKGGGEGTVVFDSAIALLQGLFPPNPNNKIVLANETTIVAPMGGYQYVTGTDCLKVETVTPGTDRSLESWTDCPVRSPIAMVGIVLKRGLIRQAFEEHIQRFYASDEFKMKAREAEPFFNGIRDFVFGRPLSLQNIVSSSSPTQRNCALTTDSPSVECASRRS
jgi:lysosomal acid phosphatase